VEKPLTFPQVVEAKDFLPSMILLFPQVFAEFSTISQEFSTG